MRPGVYGASCGQPYCQIIPDDEEWSTTINQNVSLEHQTTPLWMEKISNQLSSTQSVIKACIGWIFELGITQGMPFFQQTNLALINRVAFTSLLLALPGTFLLILMRFAHPFSLLMAGVAVASLTLGLNGVKRVAWSVHIFAFSPAFILLSYSMLEFSSGSSSPLLNYMVIRQALCFTLLLPVLLLGYEGRQKALGLVGIGMVILLSFDIGSMHFELFQNEIITGLDHGLFTVLSLFQYVALSGCVLYLQVQTSHHESHLQHTQEKLQKLAIKDGLTGLYNRKFMEELIGDAINRSRRSNSPLALLMIDVDFFKHINDTFGHHAGDEVLLRLTRLLDRNKRSTDYLGRWGGDELVLLLTNTDLIGAANLAEKLRQLVKQHYFPHTKKLTISLGASEFEDGDSPASLMARADAALYQAKGGGRNKVGFNIVDN
jgi:diguanylate cyclase (GGDEF)-like protein